MANKIWKLTLVGVFISFNIVAMNYPEEEASCCSMSGLSEWYNRSYLKDNFKIVFDGHLYRSGTLSAERLEYYITQQPGIKTVVNLRNSQPGVEWWQSEAAICQKHGILFINVETSCDKPVKREVFEHLIQVFRQAPTPILIHDKGGVARTGEVAALWLITRWDPEEIRNFIIEIVKNRESIVARFNTRTDKALEQLSLWNLHIDWLNPKRDFVKRTGDAFANMVADKFMQEISANDPLLQATFLAGFLDSVYSSKNKDK